MVDLAADARRTDLSMSDSPGHDEDEDEDDADDEVDEDDYEDDGDDDLADSEVGLQGFSEAG